MITIIFLSLALGLFAGFLPGIGVTTMLILLTSSYYQLPPEATVLSFIVMVITGNYVSSIMALQTSVPGAESSIPVAEQGYRIRSEGLLPFAIKQNVYSTVIGNSIGLFLLPFAYIALQSIYPMLTMKVQTAIIIAGVLFIVFSASELGFALLAVVLAFMVSNLGYNAQDNSEITFGLEFLSDGLPWLAVVTGVLVGSGLRPVTYRPKRQLTPHRSVPSHKGFIKHAASHSVLGFFLGLTPGLSYVMSSLVASRIAMRKGSPMDVVVASDSASAAGVMAMLLPLFVFGLPITAGEAYVFNVTNSMGAFSDVINALTSSPWMLVAVVAIANVVGALVALAGHHVLPLLANDYLKYVVVIIATGIVMLMGQEVSELGLYLSSFLAFAALFYFLPLPQVPFVFVLLVAPHFLSNIHVLYAQ